MVNSPISDDDGFGDEPPQKSSGKKIGLIVGGAFVVAALVAGSVFAFRPASSETPADAAEAAETVEPEIGGSLTVLEAVAPTNFYGGGSGHYPVATVINQVGDKLTYQDPVTGEISPWLAESWEINADATEYVFHLREDVTFSDGTALNAAIVGENFDHWGLGNTDLGLAKQEFINNYVSSEVVDEFTVKFSFSASVPGFLQATSVVGAAIAAKSTIDLPFEQQSQADAFVGTGPYVISSVVPEQEFVLTVREDYDWAPEVLEHQGRGYLDDITVVVQPEDSTRLGSLSSGQADVIRTVQPFDEQGLTDAGFEVFAAPTNAVNPALSLRFADSRLAEKDVREALFLATDRQAIIDTIFTENYPIATSLLSEGAPGYVDLSDKLAYDPEEAVALLDNAGWVPGADGIREKDGVRLEVDTWVEANITLNQQTLEIVAQQWDAIGVKLNISNPDAATRVADQKDPAKIPVRTTHVARMDPDVLKSAYHTENRNYLLSTDATLDQLLVDVSQTFDTEERLDEAAQIQNYILDNFYSLPLFELPQVFGVAPTVHGFGVEPVARASLYNTWKSE